MSNAVYLNVYPFVASGQRSDWEDYASKNNYWVDESIDVQSLDDTYHGPIIREYENFEFIHTNYDDLAANGTSSRGPYLPTWYVAEWCMSESVSLIISAPDAN